VQLPPLQTYGQTAPLSCQCPVELQSCGWRPLQRLEPGVQSPQIPAPKHTPPEHAVPLCHWPVASQVCGVVPVLSQRTLPGVQTPVQLPAVQRNGHVVPLVQFPFASHVRGVRPEQSFDPGTQTPVHLPAEHTKVHGALLIHVPWALQN